MTDALCGKPIQYVATIGGVREVSLLGRADLAFWQTRLEATGLTPAERDGRAQLLITTVDARFKGIRFQELSIAVAVTRREGEAAGDAYYLARAFNSRRLFAWIERTCFSTPYYPAAIRVAVQPTVALELTIGNQLALRAAMSPGGQAAPRAAARSGQESWTGPIFLPGRIGQSAAERRFFVAQIGGLTEAFAFSPADELAINPAAEHDILQALLDSRFAVQEWVVRANARHAKSKTYALGSAPCDPFSIGPSG